MNTIRENLRGFARQFGAEFHIASGQERTSGQQLCFLWSGSKRQFAYFGSRIFESGTARTRRIGRRPLAMAAALAASHGCSMSIVLIPRLYAPLLKGGSDICLPLWVDCEVELCEERTYATCASLRDDLRKIRKYDLTWTSAESESEIHHFYERIYWPTVTSSHGAAVLPASREKRLRQYARGDIDLVNVVFDGNVVAGVTIDYRDRIPALRDVGVLDGSPEIKKMGAITAANLFAMDFLTERGHSCVRFGLSRSFLDDGVLNFKRKFMPVVTDGSGECILLAIRELNAPVRSLLRASACITWQDGKLCRTYFRDKSLKASSDLPRRHRSEWLFGLTEETVFDVSGCSVQAF